MQLQAEGNSENARQSGLFVDVDAARSAFIGYLHVGRFDRTQPDYLKG